MSLKGLTGDNECMIKNFTGMSYLLFTEEKVDLKKLLLVKL
jgi:hypothetical protein